MCGRYDNLTSREAYRAIFQAMRTPDLGPSATGTRQQVEPSTHLISSGSAACSLKASASPVSTWMISSDAAFDAARLVVGAR